MFFNSRVVPVFMLWLPKISGLSKFLVMVNFIECIYNRYLEKDEAGLVRSTFTEVYNLAVGRSGDEAAELGLQIISPLLSLSRL